MKKQCLALLCIFAINGVAIADDTQARLNAMDAERDSVFKQKGTSESYFAENCPKQLAFWRQAAQQGQVIAIAKDETQAVAWFRKAAEQGYAPAQKNLGVAYANGIGIAKDESQAAVWFRKAFQQGYAPPAQEVLRQLSE